jgi:hypothetical protein
MMVRTRMDVDVYNVSIHDGWPTMHIGHQVAYLQIFIMPYLFQCLFQAAYPADPMLQKTTCCVFIHESPLQWPLQGRRTHTIPKCLRERKKLSMRLWMEVTNGKSMLRTYLVPIAVPS